MQNDGKERTYQIGLKYVVIDLGVVEILEDITCAQREQRKDNLLRSGLE
jgi:hypothetical protein